MVKVMKWARLARYFFGENLYFPKIKKLIFLFLYLNLHKNVKTMLVLSKSIL